MNASNEPQSAVKYSKDFEVPADFPDILRNLTREILRENPQNIEKFGKSHSASNTAILTSNHDSKCFTSSIRFKFFANKMCSSGLFREGTRSKGGRAVYIRVLLVHFSLSSTMWNLGQVKSARFYAISNFDQSTFALHSVLRLMIELITKSQNFLVDLYDSFVTLLSRNSHIHK